MFGLDKEDKKKLDKLNDTVTTLCIEQDSFNRGLYEKVDYIYNNLIHFDQLFEDKCNFKELLNKVTELNESFQSISQSLYSFNASVNKIDDQKDYFTDLLDKIQESNDQFERKQKISQSLMNELHGIAGIVRSLLNDKKIQKPEYVELICDRFDQLYKDKESLDEFLRHLTNVLSRLDQLNYIDIKLDKLLKEFLDERRKKDKAKAALSKKSRADKASAKARQPRRAKATQKSKKVVLNGKEKKERKVKGGQKAPKRGHEDVSKRKRGRPRIAKEAKITYLADINSLSLNELNDMRRNTV